MDEDFSAESLSRPGALIGWKVEVFESIGSTNEEAMNRGEKGEKEGLVIVAEAQEKGRGRLGRIWESPAGVNLLMSLLLRPGVRPEEASMITLFSAVAAARAVERETDLRPRIKWPNDLEFSGRKVCGILTEMKVFADRLEYAVAGIGLNVNMDVKDLPPGVAERATSILAELGRPVSRLSLARSLFEEFEKSYLGFLKGEKGAILKDWHERARMRGEDVEVMLDGDVIEGRVRDLDEHGALLLDTERGLRRILAGDVQRARKI